jgi:hypothetical protein
VFASSWTHLVRFGCLPRAEVASTCARFSLWNQLTPTAYKAKSRDAISKVIHKAIDASINAMQLAM